MSSEQDQPGRGGATSTQTATAEPKCPSCEVQGIEHITSRESVERSRSRQPWFLVIYCSNCGHIYDTVAKHVFTQTTLPKFVLPTKTS